MIRTYILVLSLFCLLRLASRILMYIQLISTVFMYVGVRIETPLIFYRRPWLGLFQLVDGCFHTRGWVGVHVWISLGLLVKALNKNSHHSILTETLPVAAGLKK